MHDDDGYDAGPAGQHGRRLDEPLGEPSRQRKRLYFAMMGTCLLLIVLAWNVVRFWSVPAAAVMSVVAALIPPTAAIVANWNRG